MNQTTLTVVLATSLAAVAPSAVHAELALVEPAATEDLARISIDEIAAPRGATAAYLVMGTFAAGDQRELWTIVETVDADGGSRARFEDPEGTTRCWLERGEATEAAGKGLPTGKRQHKPFVVTKPVDKLVDPMGVLMYQGTGHTILDGSGSVVAVASTDHGWITTLELVAFAAAFEGRCM